jgi:hypothetical protein
MRTTEGVFPFLELRLSGRPSAGKFVVLPSPPPTIAIVPKVLIAHKLENSRSDPNVVNTRVMVMRTRGRMPRLFPDLLCDPPGLTVFPSDPAVR